MAAYLNNQQQVQLPPHEIIPLQRMTTREELDERQRIRDIFDKVFQTRHPIHHQPINNRSIPVWPGSHRQLIGSRAQADDQQPTMPGSAQRVREKADEGCRP